MPKGRIAVLLLICATGLPAGSLLPRVQNVRLEFTLINKTGFDIIQVNVSPSKENAWGEDVLDVEVLEDGQSVRLEFDMEEEALRWDLLVQDEIGTAVVWEQLDLTDIESCTLMVVGGVAIAEIKRSAGPRPSA